MNNNVKNHSDRALRAALQREGAQLQTPERLSAKTMVAIRRQACSQQLTAQPLTAHASSASAKRRLWVRWIAAAAVVTALALVIIVPRQREARERARFEGSYVVQGGQRVEDYRLIKTDIREALSMAEQAEAFAQ